MVISTLWPPPTSHPASSWISPLRLIPFVTVVVAHRPDEISPVSSFTFATSHSPYAGGFFTDAFTGSSLLPLAFADPRAARLPLGPFLGRHFGAARFILYCGLLLCSPFSGGYNVSAHLVAHMHWLPATWPPDRPAPPVLTFFVRALFAGPAPRSLRGTRTGLPPASKR